MSDVKNVRDSGAKFVFTDGHSIPEITNWFHELDCLESIDWESVFAKQWSDSPSNPDRKRRKQAEFLVHRFCDWSLVGSIGVVNHVAIRRVEAIFEGHGENLKKPVAVKREWYCD